MALTFHDQLSVVGHARATVGADHAAVFAHTPLGSVRHTDSGREAPVVDHAGDHEGCVPAVPLLQDRGRERRNHIIKCSQVTWSLEAPPIPRPGRLWGQGAGVAFHHKAFPWLADSRINIVAELIQEGR